MDFSNLKACVSELTAGKEVTHMAVRVGEEDRVLCDVCYNTDEKTLFDMASVTKILSAAPLAWIALEKGKLRLDDSVSDFFECPADKKAWTLRRLLTHTIGLGNLPLFRMNCTNDTAAEVILNRPLDMPAGSDTRYSCPAFILLAKWMELVFGGPLDRLFEEKIAQKLHMTSTSYLPTERKNIVNANLAAEELGIVHDGNARCLGGVAGNAGIFSNLADMTEYAKMLLRHGAPLIGRELFDLACANHTPGMSDSRGLGFLYVDRRYPQTGRLFPEGSFGHCGHTGQSIFVDPYAGRYVIILSDATISNLRKHGDHYRYDEVMAMRRRLHNAIAADLSL